MFYYNVSLTFIALAMLSVILIVAPMFRRRLNEQFLLGARNQAFTDQPPTVTVPQAGHRGLDL